MATVQPPGKPSRPALLAEIAVLRQRVADLEQEKHDLEVMLEMATDHADDLSEALQQERDDLETMLEMTTDHADAVEATRGGPTAPAKKPRGKNHAPHTRR